MQLTSEQAEAADFIGRFITHPSPRRPYCVLHGVAGTGKTVTLCEVARRFPGTWLTTLTGKAADVLRRKSGLGADTIHSTFYKLEREVRLDGNKTKLEWSGAWNDNELADQTVLIDECSMLDHRLAKDLLRTGVRIVACGDPGQLPPIEGEQFFNQPDIELTHIHRQAQDSPIIRQAHRVRLGHPYEADTDDFLVVPRAPPEAVQEADIILCWKNTSRQIFNGVMRQKRGFLKPHPQAGEPVMCLKNNRDYGVFNGSIYQLARDVAEDDTSIWILYDGYEMQIRESCFQDFNSHLWRYRKPATQFVYSYAATVHKAQGSEWPFVIVIDEMGSDRPEYRKWMYTALTRASKRVMVVRA